MGCLKVAYPGQEINKYTSSLVSSVHRGQICADVSKNLVTTSYLSHDPLTVRNSNIISLCMRDIRIMAFIKNYAVRDIIS